MLSIVIFLIILTLLIVLHELGHFLAARRYQVHIEEFGVGLPPKAATLFTWKGIPFTLNWLPIGGFVRMEGENGTADAENPIRQLTDKIQKTNTLNGEQTFPFYTRPAWQRLIIVLAGVAVNFAFGVVAFTILFSLLGIPTRTPEPFISYISPGSPAEQVGLKQEDSIRFIQVEDTKEPIESDDEFVRVVGQHKGKEIRIGITRDGQEQEIEVRVRADSEIPAGDGALGVAVTQEKLVHYPWYEMPLRGAVVGVRQSVEFGVLILRSLGTMVTGIFTQGKVPADVSGPVGIANEVRKQGLFEAGPLAILNFSAVLSVNLAIMNLLPIPALDGGRAVFILIERLFSKAKRGRIENVINTAGMAFLLLLLLLITVKDVVAIIF